MANEHYSKLETIELLNISNFNTTKYNNLYYYCMTNSRYTE